MIRRDFFQQFASQNEQREVTTQSFSDLVTNAKKDGTGREIQTLLNDFAQGINAGYEHVTRYPANHNHTLKQTPGSIALGGVVGYGSDKGLEWLEGRKNRKITRRRVVLTSLGAASGAIVGSAFGERMDERDQKKFQELANNLRVFYLGDGIQNLKSNLFGSYSDQHIAGCQTIISKYSHLSSASNPAFTLGFGLFVDEYNSSTKD